MLPFDDNGQGLLVSDDDNHTTFMVRSTEKTERTIYVEVTEHLVLFY